MSVNKHKLAVRRKVVISELTKLEVTASSLEEAKTLIGDHRDTPIDEWDNPLIEFIEAYPDFSEVSEVPNTLEILYSNER